MKKVEKIYFMVVDQCFYLERELLSLPARFSGIGLTDFPEAALYEYQNSTKITESLSTLIINESTDYNIDPEKLKKNKSKIKQQTNIDSETPLKKKKS